MTTTPAQAKRIVVGASLATGVLTTLTATVERHRIPRARSLVAVTIAAVFLLALSDVAPTVTTGFAALMLVAALTASVPGLRAVATLTGGKTV